MEIREEDITIKIIDMEIGIHEQVIKASDGHYTILLNARDAGNQRLEAYEHALKHLRNDDFQKSNVQKIETDAHVIEDQEPTPAPKKAKRRRMSEAAFERKWARLQQLREERERLFGYDAFQAAENRWADPDR